MWDRLKQLAPAAQTPCYVYDLDRVKSNARSFMSSIPPHIRVLYATMANPRADILRVLWQEGVGAFVNSASHLRYVRDAGIPCKMITFAGAGHSPALLKSLAAEGITYIADSFDQLSIYKEYSPKGHVGVRVNLASLLELTPAKDPAPRFGMSVRDVQKLLDKDGISVLHVYVGTNLMTRDLHIRAMEKLNSLASEYKSICEIDVGGGFAGSPMDNDGTLCWQSLFDKWRALPRVNDLLLTIEPGRSIVRTAGHLFVSVTDVKTMHGERFVVVDSSGTWYPRTIVHGAIDHVVTITSQNVANTSIARTYICGSSTFSRDYLAVVDLPPLKKGDIIQFETAGAYCESMHLDFLGIEAPAVWVVEGESAFQRTAGIA